MPPSSRKRNHPDNDDDGDVGDIKVIPFKRRNMNYSQEEEVKTIKIVKDSSPVTERVMCNICGASLMSQAYLDRHIKSRHSDDPLVCNCGSCQNFHYIIHAKFDIPPSPIFYL